MQFIYKIKIYLNLFYSRCHGIPDLRKLENGDFINIDICLNLDGYHGDNSVMC